MNREIELTLRVSDMCWVNDFFFASPRCWRVLIVAIGKNRRGDRTCVIV